MLVAGGGFCVGVSRAALRTVTYGGELANAATELGFLVAAPG
jgi:hypothetical protein